MKKIFEAGLNWRERGYFKKIPTGGGEYIKVPDFEKFLESFKKDHLIPGETYTLKHTGEFCYCVGNRGFVNFSSSMNDSDRIVCIYVGSFNQPGYGMRNLFLNDGDKDRRFIIFSDDLNYIEK